MAPDPDDIRARVGRSVQAMIADHMYLLEYDLNERTITHKLAERLQECFQGWDVDCEYNRNHDVKKMLPLPHKKYIKRNDIHARTVFPDIIIHERGTDRNLVVIEVKKSTNPESDKWDLAKLAAFRAVLGYRVTVFIRFHRTGHADVSFPK